MIALASFCFIIFIIFSLGININVYALTSSALHNTIKVENKGDNHLLYFILNMITMNLNNRLEDLPHVVPDADGYYRIHRGSTIRIRLSNLNSSIFSNLPEIDGLKKETFLSIKSWFSDVLNGNLYLNSINGIVLGDDTYNCDYCLSNIEDNNTYFYCLNCHQDMCSICYNNKNSDALNKFEKTSQQCKDLHIIQMRDFQYKVYCDLCNNDINTEYKFTNKPFIPSDWNTYDICIPCSTSDEGKFYIKDKNLVKISNSLQYDDSGYGNFLDWIPIYSDDLSNFICINLNSDSVNYMKISLAVKNSSYYDSTIRIIMLIKGLDELINDIKSSSFYDFEHVDHNDEYSYKKSLIGKIFYFHSPNN